MEFSVARRPTFLKIDLDAIHDNLEIVKSLISVHTEIIAVVKGNAYGHGSAVVSRYLQNNGVKHFAVATSLEGEELRAAGILGNIHVLGEDRLYDNLPQKCHGRRDVNLLYQPIPTVAGVEFLSSWYDYWRENHRHNSVHNDVPDAGPVVIMIDSGMTRYGCLPEHLPDIVTFCEEHSIPIHSLMTHFSQSWDDPVFTQKQIDVFVEAVRPYREKGIKLHVADSGAIVNKVGVDLDFVRTGKLLFGRTKGRSKSAMTMVQKLGFKPALTWKVRATMVKEVPPGQSVGYYHTYTCTDYETIAIIPIGYGDCLHLNMFKDRHIVSSHGIRCQVIGEVSMDAMTVRLPKGATGDWVFHVVWPEYGGHNNSMTIDTSAMCFPISNIDRRVPRLYTQDGNIHTDGAMNTDRQNGMTNMYGQNGEINTDLQNGEIKNTGRQNGELNTGRQNGEINTGRQNWEINANGPIGVINTDGQIGAIHSDGQNGVTHLDGQTRMINNT